MAKAVDTEIDIELTVNGQNHELTVESRKLLAQVLREELGHTELNIGCDTSICGCCTVLMEDKAVKSCAVFAGQADGVEITTVDGLGEDGELHPLQESFSKNHATQCGYCTPGFIMSAIDFLDSNPDPSREEIREGLEGNICRCTGYQNIVSAVEDAANEL